MGFWERKMVGVLCLVLCNYSNCNLGVCLCLSFCEMLFDLKFSVLVVYLMLWKVMSGWLFLGNVFIFVFVLCILCLLIFILMDILYVVVFVNELIFLLVMKVFLVWYDFYVEECSCDDWYLNFYFNGYSICRCIC